MKKKIIIFGAGGHALSCIDVIENSSKYKIIFLLEKKGEDKKILNYNIFKEKKDLKYYKKFTKFAFIGVGQMSAVSIRKKIFDKLIKEKFSLPSIISNKSSISKNVKIGIGTIVMHGVKINSGVKIGKNCIINTGSIIEHGSIIGDNCHVSTGVILNGNVIIGRNSFIGSGSILREDIKIKKNSFIKMGSILKKNK